MRKLKRTDFSFLQIEDMLSGIRVMLIMNYSFGEASDVGHKTQHRPSGIEVYYLVRVPTIKNADKVD